MVTGTKVLLDIDNDMVQEAVKVGVANAIMDKVGGADKLAYAMVDTILNLKVDSNGRVNQYSGDNKYPWLDMMLRNRIQQFAIDAFEQYLKENEADFKKKCIEQLKKSPNKVADALFKTLEGSLQSKWMHSLTIELK